MRIPSAIARHVLACGLLLPAVLAGVARAQPSDQRPQGIEGVGVDEKRGEQIPLNLKFYDESGRLVQLKDIFNGERPVLLSLNYSNCPMLCGVQLNGLVDTLKQMEWTTGDEFRVVSVSIDPAERPHRAKQTEQKYLNLYGRPGVGDGWNFLTSNHANIQALADAVGFRYKFLPERQEFSHTAALMVCTPKGVVSRYLYGVTYDPQTVRLSLVEAGEGRVGSAVDQVLLFCFHYDETEGRYGPAARNLMTVGGAVTVMVLAAFLLPLWLRRDGGDDGGEPEDATARTQHLPAPEHAASGSHA